MNRRMTWNPRSGHSGRARLAGLAAAGIVAAMLSACGDDDPESSSAPAAETGPVEYVDQSPCPKLDGAPKKIIQPAIAASAALTWLYVGEDEGIFESCGLSLDVRELNPQTQVSAYVSGEMANTAVTGGGLPATVAASGRPLDVLGVLIVQNMNFVVTRPEIKTAQDLVGKTVAALSPVDSTNKNMQYYLDKNDIDPSQVKFIYVNTVPNLVAALKSGSAVAAAISSPSAQIAEAAGMKIALDFSTTPDKAPALPIIADPEWLKKNPDVGRNMLRAIAASVWKAKTDPEAATNALINHLDLDPNTDIGKITIDASLEYIAKAYQPVADILSNDPQTLELFKTTASDEVQKQLGDKDMTEFAGTLGKELEDGGFLDRLQELYGPEAG
jgi:ABC-type nitrate/sulfonate/bicarbonate transport system substrate-binding protein